MAAAQATFKSIKSLVPLLDRVLVQRFKAETKTSTGIFLPSSATSNPLPEATVIAVGPGAPNKEGTVMPTSVKAGDRVLLPGWGGNSIKVGENVPFPLLLSAWGLMCVFLGVLPVQGLGHFGED
ncbi:chaperonin 10 kd subunit-domain-containing protein [Lactarius sanguifluus]|nr:chaperonin 10 kd subunit-domain-containing protein [Lactarius sanguifluus]